MLDITIIAIGKVKDKNYQAATEEYTKRLRPYARLKIIEIAAVPFSSHSQEQAKEIEGKRIKEALVFRTGQIFLLAERGKNFTSSDLAKFIEKSQPVILVIGGALGFSQDLYQNYPQLSLSPLTFPHELARVILLEQLYRVTTILNQKAYHY